MSQLRIRTYTAECLDGRRISAKRATFSAHLVHDFGRALASPFPAQKEGDYVALVTFSVWCEEDPSLRIDNITMKIPYSISVSWDMWKETIVDESVRRLVAAHDGDAEYIEDL